MRKTKAIAQTTAILILIIIIIVGSVGVYFATLPPPEPPPPPPPPPGEFEITNLTVAPTSVTVGDSVTVSVDVENTGGTEVTGTVTVAVNDVVAGTTSVTLAGGATKTETFTITKAAGTYAVTIPGTTLAGSFKVTVPPPQFVKDNKLICETGNVYQWLDPHVSYYSWDYHVLYHTVETLVWYNGSSSSQVIPWLAESFGLVEGSGGTAYEAKLREGITFQDGTPFNATAVWFSYNRLLILDGYSGVGTPGSQAAWIVQQMLNEDLSTGLAATAPTHDNAWVKAVLDQNFVEIVDNYNVKFNLLNPTTAILDYLSGAWAGIVSPTSVIEMDYEHHGWDFAGEQNPLNMTKYFERLATVNGDTALNLPENGWRIGTGPYLLESVDPTTYRIYMVINPDYWGGSPDCMFDFTPSIESIELLYVPAFTTRLLDLRAYDVTGIAVDPADAFSVFDRDTWIEQGEFASLIPDVSIYGLYSQFTSTWFNFCTNVTDAAGNLREFQPFADWRFRKAVVHAVNLTDININVNNRIWLQADNLIPPGTAPTGAYDPNAAPKYELDLALTEQLLLEAMNTPMTQFNYYNGTPIPAGIIDNSFGPDNPRLIELYVPSGAVTNQKVLTVLIQNLNAISINNDMGLTWAIVTVPGGQQYTLAAQHRVHMYWGGWHADYNHIMNWLWPMLHSQGSYFSWNLINDTVLDTLWDEIVVADRAGDADTVLAKGIEMVQRANEQVYYLMLWYRMSFFVRSSFLQNYYFNAALGSDVYTSMYYETS